MEFVFHLPDQISMHFYNREEPRVTPQSGPSGPVERGFVERIPCLDTEQLAASVGGLGQSHLPEFAELLNSKLAAILACL